MNILYLLGNGFDLAQGMETRYTDFYKFLQLVSPKSELEKKVIADIRSDYKSWADMEEALGKYTSEWKDPHDFISVLSFLKVHLKSFLQKQNDAVHELNLSAEKLVKDICYPEQNLSPKGQFDFGSSRVGGQSNRAIRVVTFNYTNTFEQVLSPVMKSGRVLKRDDSSNISLEEIMHIHGALDDMLLVGVNDANQMDNVSFRDNQFLIEEFVKPEINDGCSNARNDYFERWIQGADVIVIFGVSLGPTDERWWRAIGRRLNLDSLFRPIVLYFPFDPDKNVGEHENYIRRWSNEFISFLRQRMELNLPEKEISRNVLIGINTDFLHLRAE